MKKVTISAANAMLNVIEDVIGHIELLLADYEHEQEFEEKAAAILLMRMLEAKAKRFQRTHLGQ